MLGIEEEIEEVGELVSAEVGDDILRWEGEFEMGWED